MSARSKLALPLIFLAGLSGPSLTAAQAPASGPARPASAVFGPPPVKSGAQGSALPALPLDQIPSSLPRVDYNNSQLTIVARNSTLGDILREVHARTGAAIEMPSNSTERVVGLFGPGQPRDVLASLLNGSHFDYVLLGSPARPNVLERVILITKTGPDEVGSAKPAAQSAQAAQDTPEEDSPDETIDESQVDSTQPSDDAQPDQSTPPAVKTPEQLLQELQRQQLLQQRQGQGGPGQPGSAPPN